MTPPPVPPETPLKQRSLSGRSAEAMVGVNFTLNEAVRVVQEHRGVLNETEWQACQNRFHDMLRPLLNDRTALTTASSIEAIGGALVQALGMLGNLRDSTHGTLPKPIDERFRELESETLGLAEIVRDASQSLGTARS